MDGWQTEHSTAQHRPALVRWLSAIARASQYNPVHTFSPSDDIGAPSKVYIYRSIACVETISRHKPSGAPRPSKGTPRLVSGQSSSVACSLFLVPCSRSLFPSSTTDGREPRSAKACALHCGVHLQQRSPAVLLPDSLFPRARNPNECIHPYDTDACLSLFFSLSLSLSLSSASASVDKARAARRRRRRRRKIVTRVRSAPSLWRGWWRSACHLSVEFIC